VENRLNLFLTQVLYFHRHCGKPVEKKIACGKKWQKDDSSTFPQAIFSTTCGNVEKLCLSIESKYNI
jgi:hypothetical protein